MAFKKLLHRNHNLSFSMSLLQFELGFPYFVIVAHQSNFYLRF